jgi:hypothetical protein
MCHRLIGLWHNIWGEKFGIEILESVAFFLNKTLHYKIETHFTNARIINRWQSKTPALAV